MGKRVDIRSVNNSADVLYSELNSYKYDLYCYPGHPARIHDKYGALAVEEFYNIVLSKLATFNVNIYRVSASVFAIPHSDEYPLTLQICFKGECYDFKKRVIAIDKYI